MKVRTATLEKDDTRKYILVDEPTTTCNKVKSINSARDIIAVLNSKYKLSRKAEEYLYLLCFTNEKELIYIFEVSHGGFMFTPANVKEILIRAILCGATVIMLVHNHPSGDVLPSVDDERITRSIKKGAATLDIHFADHIIVGGSDYYSFMEDENQAWRHGF